MTWPLLANHGRWYCLLLAPQAGSATSGNRCSLRGKSSVANRELYSIMYYCSVSTAASSNTLTVQQCSAGASGRRQARPPGLAGGCINVLALLLCVLWSPTSLAALIGPCLQTGVSL